MSRADLTHRAAVLIDAGRPAEALPLVAQALTAHPHDVHALLLQSMALSALDRDADAIDSAEAAVRLEPGGARALGQLSAALRQAGKPKRAVEVASEAIRAEPRSARAHRAYAEALLAAGRPHQAVSAAGESIRLAPADPAGYDLAGRGELACKRPQVAERSFREALRLKPDTAVYLNNLGVALLRSGRRAEAAELFTAAARADPRFERARQNTDRLVGRYVRLWFWIPAYAGLRVALILFGRGDTAGGVTVLAVAVAIGVVATGVRLPRAARAYAGNVLRLRLPTRRQAGVAALACAGFAAAHAVATRLAFRDGLAPVLVRQAGAVALLLAWMATWRRRTPKHVARPAGLRERWIGAVDVGAALVLGVLLPLPMIERSEADAVLAVSALVTPPLYLAYVDGVLGGSRLRKAFGGSYVVTARTGERPGFGRGLARTVARIALLPVLPVTVLLVAGRRRAPYDLLAGTAVVIGSRR